MITAKDLLKEFIMHVEHNHDVVIEKLGPKLVSKIAICENSLWKKEFKYITARDKSPLVLLLREIDNCLCNNVVPIKKNDNDIRTVWYAARKFNEVSFLYGKHDPIIANFSLNSALWDKIRSVSDIVTPNIIIVDRSDNLTEKFNFAANGDCTQIKVEPTKDGPIFSVLEIPQFSDFNEFCARN